MPRVTSVDHFVLTVSDIAATVSFYRALGLTPEEFAAADGTTRTALLAPGFKINLHPAKAPFAPHAAHPRPGTADVCLLTDDPLADWQATLADAGIDVIEGPVARTGARGPITSLYLRDPDGNLVEISTYG